MINMNMNMNMNMDTTEQTDRDAWEREYYVLSKTHSKSPKAD
jgi:hypothetical protein